MMKYTNFFWILLILLVSACGSKKSPSETNDYPLSGLESRLQNVEASFKQKQQSLGISFSEPIALSSLKIIVIKGAIVADLNYDGTVLNNLDLDIAKLPEGPLLFKFITKNGKELNEIFRITNKTIPEE